MSPRPFVAYASAAVLVVAAGTAPATARQFELTVENIMRGTPMARYGEPDELIGAALLLLSPKAGSFITGAAVNVDGGFTAAWF